MYSQQNNLLTPLTIQAHCTFLSSPSLTQLSSLQTSIAHCPLSNAYFSAKPFPLREALERNVKVGLGTDIAGGYSIDIMDSMRQAVAVSRMREGEEILKAERKKEEGNLSIDWKEALYLATTGGAIAMGLKPGVGTFEVGAPFDVQQSESYNKLGDCTLTCMFIAFEVKLLDLDSKVGVGAMDFFGEESTKANWQLSLEHVEKWWCLGDVRNRESVWVQGRRVWSR